MTVTLERFHEDILAAEQATANGPVFITENGDAKHVLVNIAEYRRWNPLSHKPERNVGTLIDLCAVPVEEYFDWQPERIQGEFRPFEFE